MKHPQTGHWGSSTMFVINPKLMLLTLTSTFGSRKLTSVKQFAQEIFSTMNGPFRFLMSSSLFFEPNSSSLTTSLFMVVVSFMSISSAFAGGCQHLERIYFRMRGRWALLQTNCYRWHWPYSSKTRERFIIEGSAYSIHIVSSCRWVQISWLAQINIMTQITVY